MQSYFGGGATKGPGRRMPPALAGPDPTRKSVTRRSFVRGCATVLAASAAAVGLGGVYAWQVEPNWFEVTRPQIWLPHLSPALDGLTIAQLSDLHVGPLVDESAVTSAVDQVNDLRPDMVVLTGDFVTQSATYAEGVAAQLGRLTSRYGVFAVLGNHDVWTDPDRIADRIASAGVVPLRDRAVDIDIEGERLWLVGLEDAGYTCYTGGRTDGFVREWAPRVRRLDDILTSLDENTPRLLLVHNPDVNEFLGGRRIDLALSGHTHGGQVRLPLLGAPLLPSCMGQKYAGGLAAGPEWPVYVNRGIGVTGIPMRLNCRPEITLLTLRAGDGRQR